MLCRRQGNKKSTAHRPAAPTAHHRPPLSFTLLFTTASFVAALLADPALAASLTAVATLAAAVATVAALVNNSSLPATTADVLARVSFVVLLPCLQFSSVGATLARDSIAPGGLAAAAKLAILPAAAIAHVCIGASLGSIAGRVAEGRFSLFPRRAWHAAANPAPSAPAAAAAVAAATGAPGAAGALLPPPPPGSVRGTRALVTAAASFGNAVSLPLALLAAVLPDAVARDAAAAYVSLYALGWSPLLWTAGAALVDAAATARGAPSPRARAPGDAAGAPPTGLPTIASAASAGGAALARSAGGGRLAALVARARAPLASLVRRAASPPVAATAAALVLGASPLGPHLFLGHVPPAAAGGLPAELAAALAAARIAVGAARLLAPAALAVQVLVLGASVALPPVPAAPAVARNIQPLVRGGGGGDAAPPPATTTTPASFLPRPRGCGLLASAAAAARRPLPRAVAAVAAVRLVGLPLAGAALVAGARAIGLLPTDPLVTLVLLLEAATPTSQTLVVIARLRRAPTPAPAQDTTQPDASLSRALARLVMRLYILSAVPLAIAVALAARAAGVAVAGEAVVGRVVTAAAAAAAVV